MSAFVDYEGKECDFAIWYACLTGSKAQQRYELATSKDGSKFYVWSRFKGLGGQAWQTTTELIDQKQFNPKNPTHVEWNKKKDVEVSETDCKNKGDLFKSEIDKATATVEEVTP